MALGRWSGKVSEKVAVAECGYCALEMGPVQIEMCEIHIMDFKDSE